MIVIDKQLFRSQQKEEKLNLFLLLPKTRTSGNKGRLLSELLILVILVMGCANILDGPFNKNGKITPSLLFADNGTELVTFWDEDIKIYRTFDQGKNIFLSKPVFEYDEHETNNDNSKNFKIAGTSISPKTQLDSYGMQIQAEKSCTACHTK